MQMSQKNLLLEVLVAVYVLSGLYQSERWMAASRVAWRERLPVHACDLMILCMPRIVLNPVNARFLAFVARFVRSHKTPCRLDGSLILHPAFQGVSSI